MKRLVRELREGKRKLWVGKENRWRESRCVGRARDGDKIDMKETYKSTTLCCRKRGW